MDAQPASAPRKYLTDSVKAVKKVVIARYEAFGTAGHADRIKVIPLDAMFQQYDAGKLRPIVN